MDPQSGRTSQLMRVEGVKAYLQNLEIECWHHIGRLGSREPTICFYQRNPEPCNLLLRAMEELAVEGPPAKRTITFTPCQRSRCCRKLHVILSLASDDLRELCVSLDKEVVTVELTEAGLDAFQEAVTVWRDGGDDFGLSPNWTTKAQRKSLGRKDLSSGELWFWGPSYDGP